MDFSFFVETDCSKSEARVLGTAAALCLCEAIGGKAAILWPGHIMIGDDNVADARCELGENGAALSFTVADAYASETLPAEVEKAVRSLAADFPANSADIVQKYCNRCRTLMKFVDTTYRGMPVYGFAFAVDKYGGLMVMTQISRTVVTIHSGEAPLAVDEPQQPDIPFMPRV